MRACLNISNRAVFSRVLGPSTVLALAVFLTGCESTGPKKNEQAGWLVPPGTSPATRPPMRLSSSLAPPPEPATEKPVPPSKVPDKSLSSTATAARGAGVPDGKLYSFSAKELELKDALALFARSNDLNIVPDPDVTGQVTVDFRNLTLDRAMDAILDTFSYFAELEGGLIRVRKNKTEFFNVDYVRLNRSGNGSTTANISSSSSSGSSGSSSSGSTGTSAGAAGGSGGDSTTVSISKTDTIKFWDELEEQLKSMLTPSGKLAINRMVGTIMVTDHKASVDRIGDFVKHIKRTLHLQVDIEAQIYEVVFNDEFHLGIDWQNVTGSLEKWAISSGGVPAGFPSSRLIVDNPLGGLTPGAPALSLAVTKDESRVVLDALKQQGRLEVVSQPRIRTLNNQAALIKVGTEKPFFRKSVIATTGTSSQTTTDVEIQSITIGTVLSLTPQISDDGWITMDISPVITRLVDSVAGPDGATAPEVDIKQTSSLVRMKENSTVIIGGLIQNERHKTERRVPILGDIPVIGYPFRGTFENKRRTELVIFITPTIVR